MTEKEGEKVEKYQDLARGSKNVGCEDKGDSGGNWGIRISTNEFKNNLKVIDADISIEVVQKCSLLGSCKNFKKGAQEVGERKSNNSRAKV